MQKTLEHLNEKMKALVLVQWWSGCRPTEALTIRPCDIDKEGPSGCWVYRPPSHKSAHRGKERCIVLGPRAQEVLEPWLRWKPNPNDYLFKPNSDALRYSIGIYRQAIKRATERAGVPKWTPNQLRHAAATRIKKKARDIDAARMVLGHSSSATTEVYVDRDLRGAGEVMRRLG